MIRKRPKYTTELSNKIINDYRGAMNFKTIAVYGYVKYLRRWPNCYKDVRKKNSQVDVQFSYIRLGKLGNYIPSSVTSQLREGEHVW